MILFYLLKIAAVDLTAAKFTHTQRTVIYGVVIVSRNLERTNENDGFKMTALEMVLIDDLPEF